MICSIVDMHCHLDLYPNSREQIRRIIERKSYVLSVTTTPSAWRGTSEMALAASRIKTALGLHPQLAKERKSELRLFERFLPEARYIGEIGLDGGPSCRGFWRDQVEVLEHILSACVAHGGRILTLHSRAAASDVLNALERHSGFGTAVLHWFSGTQRELSRAIEMGCWFSVGPAMLRSKKGLALASRMPVDRVLTETDGPFATIDGQPLKPAECEVALSILAQLWDTDVSNVRDRVILSFRELVSL